MHDFATLCIGHLENIGLLSYADLRNVYRFHYTISTNHIRQYHHRPHQKSLLSIGKSCQAHGGFWKIPHAPGERMRVKKTNNVMVLLCIMLIMKTVFGDPPQGSRG